MKKDSFTFSDKLKKSKTLPLSKRIPSRVGGEVKAKRTFFDRAQRDLPFIIVAALALLLLPFLSRETVDIDTPSVVWGGDDGGAITEGIGLGEGNGIGDEMAMSSFRNPLDLIIRHGESDSTSKDTLETPYSSEDSDSSSYGESSRSSYGSEEYSSSPATSRYGKTVKRSVRNSINRVPTALGALRTSATIDPGAGNSGIGHTMALGSRAKDGAPRVQGPGVRPVALQPLVASGKGRDLTGGDALYAEAARSIGAMNRPGAKQAVLEAQLKDVDGKPLGDTKGTGVAAAAGKGPGAGGTPSNNWSHTNQRPWWWDMMKERSQMRWMLWHYNWEKMLSDSLIKLTSGLASCLIAGSPDFGVGHFLGKPGGESDYECHNAEGYVEELGSRSDYVAGAEIKDTSKDGGKEERVPSWLYEDYRKVCEKTYHGRLVQTSSGRQSALDVRLRCLGLKLSELKNMTENKRKGVCVNMYGDPMQIDIIAERNGKTRVKQYRKMGYYVMGKRNDKECAFAINHAIPGINDVPYEQGMTKVVVYRVGATGVGFFPEGNPDYPKTKTDKEGNTTTIDRDLTKYQNKSGDYFTEDDVYWESGDYYRGLRQAEQMIQNAIDKGECLSEQRVQEILKTYGKWRTSANSKGRFNEVAVCPVPDNRFGNSISPVRINPTDGSNASNSSPYSGIVCDKTMAYIEKVGGRHAISATIKNPGPRTIAVVLEYVQSGATVGQDYVDGKVPERTGYLVKEVIDFRHEPEWKQKTNGEETTFIGDAEIGLSSTNENDTQLVTARSGKGYVLWITTDDLTGEVLQRNELAKGKDLASVMKITKNKGYATGLCEYIWGCDAVECGAGLNKKYCRDDADGKLYNAVEYRGYLFRASEQEIKDQGILAEVLRCEPLCQHADGGASIVNKFGSKDPIPDIAPLTKQELEDHGIYVNPNCPFCNPSETKRATGPGLVCIDPLKSNEYCPCIKVDNPITPKQTPIPGTLYIRSEVYPDNPQVEELPVTPICYKKAIALGNIYVRNPDGTAGVRVDPDGDIVTMLLRHTPEEQAQLCPFCSDDIGDVCIDPLEGNEPCPCVKVDNPRTPGVSNPLFVRSDVTTVTPRSIMLPVTPICYKKAIALGNIYVRNPDGTAGNRVDPDKDVVTMLLSKSKDVQDALCPYCNPDPGDREENPMESCPLEPVKIIPNGPCSVIIPGATFFANAWYEICETSLLEKDLEWVYDYMKNCKDIKIEGHASKTMEAGDEPPYNYEQAKERNNIRLGFDRAVEVSKKIRTIWERHGEIVSIDLSDKDVDKYDNSIDPNYLGAIGNTNYTGSRSNQRYLSLPERRATISQPTKANATATFKIISYGSSQNTTGPRPKPYSQMTSSERKDWLEKEKPDRKVVLRGTPITN